MIIVIQDWDWYFISNKEFMIPHGGHTLLLHYGSLFNILKSLHPNIDWDESKFLVMRGKGFWNLRANRRALMDLIGRKLNIRKVILYRFECLFGTNLQFSYLFLISVQPSDWYSAKRNAISGISKRSKKLWRYYSSLEEALRDLYPEYPWDPSQFAHKQFRNEKHSLLRSLIKTERQLGIQQVRTHPPKRLSSLTHSLHPLLWLYACSHRIGIQSQRGPSVLQRRVRRNCGDIILPWKKLFEICILNILGIPHNLHGSDFGMRSIPSCSWSPKQNNNWKFNRLNSLHSSKRLSPRSL